MNNMNKNLPINNYSDEIVTLLSNNDVLIITADTGAGKSTQVPQIIYNAGYDVIVTEPRRIAAITLAERVAEEMNEELGGVVGYKTAFENLSNTDTSILFCTDGLQLVKEVTDTANNKEKVLIIDEVHEWNLNIEALVAWSRKRILEGWNTKVVIMTATIEEDSLKEFFGNGSAVIKVPGRIYPVEYKETLSDICNVTEEMVFEDRNTLVFLPGRREIEEMIWELKRRELDAVILPLHAELNYEQQKRCFETYSIPKVIVATNVAQTSITIPDVDAVVDSGHEKILTTENGIEGLKLSDCSQADLIQRMGRAGRTKEGVYFLCSKVSFNAREKYSVPEIQRTNLDQIVLRFEAVGIDPTDIVFFHQPEKEALVRAKNILINLGAIKDEKITDIGNKMSKLPISARYARMIIEADKLGVIDDVIIIAAILEIGTLIKNGEYYRFTSENKSDLLAELYTYKKISVMGKINFWENGIQAKKYFRVKELIKKITETLRGKVSFGTTGKREDIIKACITGLVDNLYFEEFYDKYTNGEVENFKIDKNSSTKSQEAEYVIGIPKVIEFKDRWDISQNLNLLTMVTIVELDTMIEIAPQLFEIKKGENPFWSRKGYCCSYDVIIYMGKKLKEICVEDPDNPEAERLKEEYEAERERFNTQIYNTSETPEKQTIVCVSGKEHTVYYNYMNVPSIYIEESELNNITENNVILDNGRTVMLKCACHQANNIPALKEFIRKERLSQAMQRLGEELPKIDLSNIQNIKGVIGKIGQRNIDGQTIYISLKLCNKNKICFEVVSTKLEYESNMNESMEFIFDNQISERFSNDYFKEDFYGRMVMTANSKSIKESFDKFVAEIRGNLTVENFEENLELIEEFYLDLVKGLKR